MDKLIELGSLCKAGVHVNVNQHRNYHESVAQYAGAVDEIEADVYEKMVELDTTVHIQFYPHTPVGCYIVQHYDIDAAMDEALEIARRVKQ